VDLDTNYTNFVDLDTNYTNFVDLDTNYTNFVDLDTNYSSLHEWGQKGPRDYGLQDHRDYRVWIGWIDTNYYCCSATRFSTRIISAAPAMQNRSPR
jgi:hypothetical protein